MKKVVVIGSNSFSGAHFVNLLLEKKDYKVFGISRSAEKNDIYLPYKKKSRKDLARFEFHQLDINNDIDKMLALFDKEEPDFIVNFASQSMVGESWQHPEHWYKTNVLGTVHLVNSLKDKKYLKKYVHVSTPEVYGTCSGRVKEDNPFNPSTPYAASRAAGDIFIQLLIKQFNFPAVFTRAANVYGEGQQLFKIIPRSIIFIKKGTKIPLHGGGLAERSFIHIRDVCEATISIMEGAKPGEIYHISTDKLISIRDLVKLICKKMKADYGKSVDVVETRRGLDAAYILDSGKLKKEFKWKAKIGLEQGIAEVIKWVNDNWKVIEKEPLEYIHKE
ncbi:GDP-mannose 4,6-dehydratase [Candidatus Woesearchaeota archaeon]|nr:GDP-mannose 4,6-dehydratase [Candidatus Woesearchaeota archaeon]